MTTIDDGLSRLPRIVYHDIPSPSLPVTAPTRAWRLELHEFLALADSLTAAGYHTGDVIAKLDAITTAIDAAVTNDSGKYLTDDLIDLPPAVVAERVRQAGLDFGLHLEMARVRRDFEARLAITAAAALREVSDDIILDMRKAFEPVPPILELPQFRSPKFPR